MPPENTKTRILDSEQLPFFTDSIGIVFREDIFSWDMMQTVQRTVHTQGSTDIHKLTRHRNILMSPLHAKILLDYLKRQLDAYEERYGIIEMPPTPKPERKSTSVLPAEDPKTRKGLRTMNTGDIVGYHG